MQINMVINNNYIKIDMGKRRMEKYDALKLENQLCFPLYACSREIVKKYGPYLEEIDLTYTQYVAMMVMWEHKSITSKEMGRILHLDSGTLTPLLKKMEGKGLIERCRMPEDERNLLVTLTPAGDALKDKALSVPGCISQHVNLDEEEAKLLYRLLYKVLEDCAE